MSRKEPLSFVEQGRCRFRRARPRSVQLFCPYSTCVPHPRRPRWRRVTPLVHSIWCRGHRDYSLERRPGCVPRERSCVPRERSCVPRERRHARKRLGKLLSARRRGPRSRPPRSVRVRMRARNAVRQSSAAACRTGGRYRRAVSAPCGLWSARPALTCQLQRLYVRFWTDVQVDDLRLARRAHTQPRATWRCAGVQHRRRHVQHRRRHVQRRRRAGRQRATDHGHGQGQLAGKAPGLHVPARSCLVHASGSMRPMQRAPRLAHI